MGKQTTGHDIHPEFGPVIDDDSATVRQQVETVTEFLWQGNHLIAESSYQVSGDNQQRTCEQYRSFIYEPESFKPLAQLEGEGKAANAYHYQLDHLGTPLALTRHNGATVWQVRYRAYGNVWQKEVADLAAPIETPLRFQGQYWDAETGLHYNRHRYYQPDTGRFISPDPIGLAGGINNYQYAPNPIGWVDPLGLTPTKKPVADNCPKPNGGYDIGPAQPNRQGGPEEPPTPNKKTSYEANSRREAFRQAKRDAGVPMGQKPRDITRPPLLDENKKLMFDQNGQIIKTRQYEFLNNDMKLVFIQEHSLGHVKATPKHGKEPHFNVRPEDPNNPGKAHDTKTFPGTHGHYNFEK